MYNNLSCLFNVREAGRAVLAVVVLMAVIFVIDTVANMCGNVGVLSGLGACVTLTLLVVIFVMNPGVAVLGGLAGDIKLRVRCVMGSLFVAGTFNSGD